MEVNTMGVGVMNDVAEEEIVIVEIVETKRKNNIK
jgi:hypothetical protein